MRERIKKCRELIHLFRFRKYNAFLVPKAQRKNPFYINGIIIALFFILSLFLLSCLPGEFPLLEKATPEHDYDKFQELILDLIKEDYEIKAEAFITYEILDIDEDRFYERFYLYAMIDDINPKLEVVNSYVFPFTFVFDKDRDELIRSYYPRESTSITNLRNNFSHEALEKLTNGNQDQHIQRIDKLKSTNLWNAETFYNKDEY